MPDRPLVVRAGASSKFLKWSLGGPVFG
jgi:hypothetical protein